MQSDTLRFFRVAKNQPQKAIADVLGMSQPNYSDLENGKTKINNDEAEKLAEYYGVSKEIFLPEKPPVINHNTGEHSKSINNTEQYFEADRDLLQQILERVDKLFTLLSEEKKAVAQERKMLLEIFDKLANKQKG
jgi:transcriptional regulator with XRE-family HTH domain